ncbi:TraR/DksA C4-type zinc finger protein [Paenibacillus protaetiae]|uniref:Molecular chaperone DnaK n=1 Tax=Paenibacillus protaetiae TaxID=2509456 RepID=A0A4P6ESA5_9BACL|nr:TraR/DksA C4-type zinc finger protein [Paenibacillus protaetiae]QAY65436.1 molecular chaperone DnaK [Paenibacillus protaetiae]
MALQRSQLEQLRQRLEQDKAAVERELEANGHYGLTESMRDMTGELSPIDNHPADLGSEMFERGKDIALLENKELHLYRIDAALQAMDAGTYGVCRTCGRDIPFERLEALPDALYCAEHAPRQQMSSNRPVEEQFLNPPFGRTSMDEQDSYNGFDGEDAWQIVESWGDSSSPAYSENNEATDYDHVGIEADELDGYVEPFESFVASDITGRHTYIVRNRRYDHYLDADEGDHGLEPDIAPEDEENR